MNRHVVLLYGTLAGLSVLCIALLVYVALVEIRISFATDQTAIFHLMAIEKKGDATVSIKDREEYIIGYYPSGTKQSQGSALDKVVENARALSLKCMTYERQLADLNRKSVPDGQRSGDTP